MRRFVIRHSPIAILSVLWLLFFWRRLSGQAMYPAGDFTQQFFIFRNIAYRALAAGHLPLWADCFFAGYPFQADPQSQLFYPPIWILYALLKLAGYGHFPLYALTLEATSHYLLTSIFTFYFLRAELSTLNPDSNSIPALLGSITFTYSGYLTGYPPLQTAILETATWLPLSLLALRNLTDSRNAFRSLVWPIFTLAIAFFAGHPQTFLFVVYLSIAYFVYHARTSQRSWRWILARLAAIFSLLLGLSLIQLLPQAQFLRLSTRASLSFDELARGFPVGIVTQFFVTDSVWSPLYIGILPFALAIVTLISSLFPNGAFRKGRRATEIVASGGGVLFWLLVALLGLLLSFGGDTPLYSIAYWLLPGYNLFRGQERLAFLVSFALAVLAAHGLARLLDSSAPPSTRRLIASLGTVVALGAVVGWITYNSSLPDWPSRAWLMVVGLVFTAVSFLTRLTPFARQNIFAWGVGTAVLVAVNLFVAATPSNAVAPFDPYPYFQFLDPVRAEPSAFFRVQDDARMQGHFACGCGLREWSGLSPIRPAAWSEFDQRVRESLRWKLIGMKYLITWKNGAITRENDLPPAELVAEGEAPLGHAKVYRMFEIPRRAWMINQYRTEDTREAIFAALNTPDFDPFTSAVVTLPDAAARLDRVVAGDGVRDRDVVIVEDWPGHLVVSVGGGPDSLLIVSEAYYPGWAATVNGQPAPVFEADAYLLSVSIPSSPATVELNYRPWTLVVGAAVSGLALLVCLWLVIYRPKSNLQSFDSAQARSPVPDR